MNSFINSEGCRLYTFSDSQRRPPLTTTPTPGISTSTSRNSVPIKTYGAQRCQVAIGMRNATSATTPEIAMNVAWRVRKYVFLYAANFGESGSAIDAEYTITIPSSSNRITTHSNGWSYSIIRDWRARMSIGVTDPAPANLNGSWKAIRSPAPRRARCRARCR